MATEQQEIITVTIAGVKLGVFDTCSGGGPAAPTSKYRPGGMGQEIVEKALPSYADITVGRRFDPTVDQENIRLLESVVGSADVAVNRQPADASGAPVGKPKTLTGTLSSVDPGNSDANSSATRVWMFTANIVAVA